MLEFKNTSAFKEELIKNVALQNQFKEGPVKAADKISTIPSFVPDN